MWQAWLIAGAAALFAVWLGWQHYEGLVNENKSLTAEVSQAVDANKKLANQIEIEREAAAIAERARQEAETKYQLARDKVNELTGLFAEHDFDNILQKKPTLVINKRINPATDRVLNELADSINIDHRTDPDQVSSPAQGG